MPKAIKKKPRKKTVTAEAEVKDRLSEIKETVVQKQKTVVTYGVIALIVVAVLLAGFYYNYASNKESRELEYKAYKIYHSDSAESAPAQKQEQLRQALELFQKAYRKHKSARVLLYIADSHYELDNYDEALKTLNEFIKEYADEKDLLPLAYNKIAVIQLKKGSKDEALKTLAALYSLPSDVYKDVALMESGRILEKEGKKQEALAKFKELAEKFPNSPYFEEASTRLKQEEKKQDKEKKDKAE